MNRITLKVDERRPGPNELLDAHSNSSMGERCSLSHVVFVEPRRIYTHSRCELLALLANIIGETLSNLPVRSRCICVNVLSISVVCMVGILYACGV